MNLEEAKKLTYGSGLRERKYVEGRCCESVWPDSWGSHQCYKKNGYGPEGLYCKQHSPEEVEKRRKAQEEKYEAEWAKRRIEIHGAKFLKALKEIAAGHNDARSLATSVLEEFEKK